MAATRLIALHVNKGKTVAQCLADRTDYSQNAAKTNDGEFISSYECDPKTADEEFLLSKRQYQHITGRQQKNNSNCKGRSFYIATIAVKGSALIFLLWRSTSMDRIFMDEYYEHLRADNIEAFSKERNDEYVGRAEEYKAAKSALLEGLGLEHLFDHSHELTPKEKEIWMLFDRVDVAELLARDAFAKGAYMLGAEDREIMLK